MLDIGDYPLEHPFFANLTPEQHAVAMSYHKANVKRLGCFKDEIPSSFISEFVGIRSKVYSTKLANGLEKNKCGGTTIRKDMKEFNFDLYRQVVFKEKMEVFTNQRQFHSHRHEMFLKCVKKRAFNAFDDKRFILKDGVNTLAHGHYRIPGIIETWDESE